MATGKLVNIVNINTNYFFGDKSFIVTQSQKVALWIEGFKHYHACKVIFKQKHLYNYCRTYAAASKAIDRFCLGLSGLRSSNGMESGM